MTVRKVGGDQIQFAASLLSKVGRNACRGWHRVVAPVDMGDYKLN